MYIYNVLYIYMYIPSIYESISINKPYKYQWRWVMIQCHVTWWKILSICTRLKMMMKTWLQLIRVTHKCRSYITIHNYSCIRMYMYMYFLLWQLRIFMYLENVRLTQLGSEHTSWKCSLCRFWKSTTNPNVFQYWNTSYQRMVCRIEQAELSVSLGG